MAVIRAFIAGAVCDNCGAMDRVQRCKNEGDDEYWMECVLCGWQKHMSCEPDVGMKPEERVNSNLAKPLDAAPALKPLKHR